MVSVREDMSMEELSEPIGPENREKGRKEGIHFPSTGHRRLNWLREYVVKWLLRK